MHRVELRLFQPPAESMAPEDEPLETDRPHIIPLRPHQHPTVISGRFTAPVVRARAIRENSVCPECATADVELLELEDAVISSRSHRPIPGTATIVGFHCCSCGLEWPVYEMTVRCNG